MELGAFAEIGILFGVATVVSLIMRFLRQPLIIGHIITGFLVGKYAIGLFHNLETLELFSHLGISFLLFSVGLTLNPKVLKQYGWASTANTLGQVVLTGALGVVVCMTLGFNWVTSLYVGVAISFSSTVIVLKLLADKGDLDKLYVRISVGSLLLQDLIAIMLLFMIPIVTSSSGGISSELVMTLSLSIAAGAGVFLVANYVIRYLHPYLTKSQELLFLFANAWGIGISVLFYNIGFSLEGGALIAGVALSTLPSAREIGARLAPLRDFFIVAFFILLGTRMTVSSIDGLIVPAVVLSLFVLIINPLVQLIVMGWLGYRKKTSFQTGMMAAQISEFSLILVALGVSLGQVDESVLSAVTLVGIITIFISTYFIFYSDKLYTYLAPYLGVFERAKTREKSIKEKQYDTVLLGGGRISYDFIELFKEQGINFMVLDHDPEVMGYMAAEDVVHEYGDASDPQLLEDLKIDHAQLVVSTIPDTQTNFIILSIAKRSEKPPVVVVLSHGIAEALELYDAGADYVILPHSLGGKYAASLVKRHSEGKAVLQDNRPKHIATLQKRAARGHDHPTIDKHTAQAV